MKRSVFPIAFVLYGLLVSTVWAQKFTESPPRRPAMASFTFTAAARWGV